MTTETPLLSLCHVFCLTCVSPCFLLGICTRYQARGTVYEILRVFVCVLCLTMRVSCTALHLWFIPLSLPSLWVSFPPSLSPSCLCPLPCLPPRCLLSLPSIVLCLFTSFSHCPPFCRLFPSAPLLISPPVSLFPRPTLEPKTPPPCHRERRHHCARVGSTEAVLRGRPQGTPELRDFAGVFARELGANLGRARSSLERVGHGKVGQNEWKMKTNISRETK